MTKLTPRPLQEQMIQAMCNEPTKGVLQASAPGVGKTLIAVEFILRMGFTRVLLVGVKDTVDQWAERLDAQSDGAVTLRPINATKAGRVNFEAFVNGEDGIFFTGSHYLVAQDWVSEKQWIEAGVTPEVDPKTGKQVTKRRHLKAYSKMREVQAIIIDEAHIALANRRNVARKTIMTVKAEWKVCMSATWAGNRFENCWSVCRYIWGVLIEPNFYKWRSEYCVVADVYLPGGKTTQTVTGEREPGRWVSELPLYQRVEVDSPVPPSRLVEVELTPRQRDVYTQMERDLVAYLRNGASLDPTVAENQIVMRSRLRTLTLGEIVLDAEGNVTFDMDSQSSKLYALRGILDGWGGQKALIYTDSKRFAKVTVARMRAAGYNAAEWSGDVSSKGRAALKDAFINGDLTYIVATIGSFGTGQDGYQHATNKVCWLSESENGIQNVQTASRVWRDGMTEENGGYDSVKIVARDTYDLGIFSSLVMQEQAMTTSLRAAA